MTTRSLPRSTPEAEGLDPATVHRLVRNLDGLDAVHSFMLLRGGKVVAEGWWNPYAAETPQRMFSVSKSLTSIAVGLAFTDGLLDLDDNVLDHFADEAPAEPSDNLRAMTLRHLLTMSTGHTVSTMEAIVPTNIGLSGDDWVRQLLALPVDEQPGTRFVYNTGATYLAGIIVQRLTGRRLLDYLGERILGPIGIEDVTWEQDPDGHDVGGYGLSLRTEDLARFGQFCLQHGNWNGEQLIPGEWIEMATGRRIATTHGDNWAEWQQGYGFQFWRSRFGAYRADGAFGQYAIVWPDHDIVVAITSGVQNLQSVQDAVWDALLPDLDPVAAKRAGLSADGVRPSSDVTAPADGITWNLALPLPAGAPTAPDAPMIGRTYRMAPNGGGLESLRLTTDVCGRLALHEVRQGSERTISLGHGEWVQQQVDLSSGADKLACAAAWTEPNLLVAQMVSVVSPFAWMFTLRFDGDRLAVLLDQNVSFGDTRLLEATGTAT